MTFEKMTVHKALSELKIIDDRIYKTIDEAVFCVANKHSNEKIRGIPIKEFTEQMSNGYDKSNDLIKRRDAIKRAVMKSNASTNVEVGGVEYTVAEAIEMKNHGVELLQYLLANMRDQYKEAQAEVMKNNGKDLDTRAEQYVVGIYGSKDGRVDTDDFKKAKQDFIKSNSYELVDPIHVKEKIEMLEDKISTFISDVDSALSVSNALTTVEISY